MITPEGGDVVREWEMEHVTLAAPDDGEHVETFVGTRREAVARGNELTEQTGRKVYAEPGEVVKKR